jgi:predicted nucleic-acid-binding protein
MEAEPLMVDTNILIDCKKEADCVKSLTSDNFKVSTHNEIK